MGKEKSPAENNGETTENMEVDEPHAEIKNTLTDTNLKLKLLSNVQDSRPGTPVDGSCTSTPTSSRTPQAINPCVRVLAKALLQVLMLKPAGRTRRRVNESSNSRTRSPASSHQLSLSLNWFKL